MLRTDTGVWVYVKTSQNFKYIFKKQKTTTTKNHARLLGCQHFELKTLFQNKMILIGLHKTSWLQALKKKV